MMSDEMEIECNSVVISSFGIPEERNSRYEPVGSGDRAYGITISENFINGGRRISVFKGSF